MEREVSEIPRPLVLAPVQVLVVFALSFVLLMPGVLPTVIPVRSSGLPRRLAQEVRVLGV